MTSMVMVAAVLERLGYLFPEGNPGNELIAKVKSDLLSRRAQLKKIIEDADANHNIADEDKSFGREVTRLCYEFEDFIESYVLEVTSRRKVGFLNRIFKRSSQQIQVIEKLGKQLVDTISQRSDTSMKHHAPEIIRGDRARLVDHTEEILGMEDAREQVMSALTGRKEHLDLVLICGPPGMGKTTLAKKLFQDDYIQHHFHFRAWACVSVEHKTRGILQDIVRALYGTSVGREEELAELIYKKLKGQRYLIVLDDVWSADAWNSLRMVFPNDNNGSRILITTRNAAVASEVGSSFNYSMRRLSKTQSLELLQHKLQQNGIEINLGIEQIIKEIAERCQGLPLAIVAVASVLSVKPFDEWRRVLEHVSDASSDGVLDILNLSYKNLPLRLRLCLLYLGTFPEDAVLELDTLCQLWIAEGLISIDDKRSEETMKDVAARYLEQMVNQSLVEISEEVSGQTRFKFYKIHDVIHHFCQEKRKEDEYFEVIDLRDENGTITDLGDKDQTMSIRRAIYLDKYECASSHLYGNANYLRSLLFFGSSHSGIGIIKPQEIPNLDSFIHLRVLYLYGIDFKDGKFPKGVEKLIYLRCLSFRECYLVELSSKVGNMFYLQTLDLRVRDEFEMTIPDVLDSLESLNYLYLPLAYQSLDEKKLHLGRLKKLEVIDNFDTCPCNVGDLRNWTNLVDLTVTAKGYVSEIETILNIVDMNSSHLRYLSLTIRDVDCSSEQKFPIMEKVFSCSALHTLGVEGYLCKLPELDKFSPKLTKLVLSGSKLNQDPMQVLQKLPSLSYLLLEIEAYVGKRMTCNSFCFESLTYLKLSKLFNLEEWEIDDKAMRRLRNLVIENCKKLRMLPYGLQFIDNLQQLEITSMPNEFVNRIQKSDGTEGEDFHKIRCVQNVKIDGVHLILKEREQGPGKIRSPVRRCNSPGHEQEIQVHLNTTERPE